MTLSLSNLKIKKSARKKRKRVGRGNASGHGTYSTRGLKGQKARAGGKTGITKRGIKFTLRRLPKARGFRSIYPKMTVLNLDFLNHNFNDEEIITPQKLVERGFIKLSSTGLKILGRGKLDKKLKVYAHKFSKSAKDAILKKGGEVHSIK